MKEQQDLWESKSSNMGKIRVRTIGEESLDEKPKKQKQEKGSKKTHLPGMGGGERVVMVGPTEEELEKIDLPPEEAKEGE